MRAASKYSDLPPKTNPWSGVVTQLSGRVASSVIITGKIGSLITLYRLRGNVTNYFVIGIYIPRHERTNPDQAWVCDQIKGLLMKIPKHDSIMVMGDFNSPLACNQAEFVSPWCIHTRQYSGGDRLLEIMKNFSLRAVRTCF